MADEHAEEAEELKILKQASLTIKKKTYNVILNEALLTWSVDTGKKEEICSVRVRDILAVKTNSTSQVEGSSQLVVAYVTQHKDYILKKTVVTFIGDTEACDAFCREVQRILSEVLDRPKRMLVLINPMSGQKKGEKVYKDKVAPEFLEANIQTDVIVTEKAHHSEEILATYDLKSVDALVLVSGDGLYHEVTNGLTRRMATDARQDINNLEFVPAVFSLPIGIIPCGTGNGIARVSMGNQDVQTAAFSVALGYKTQNNIMSVFSAGELVGYSSLLVGYGMWGDLIYIAENKRNQGKLRYALAAADCIFLKPFREMNLTVTYKCRPYVDKLNHENLKCYLTPETHGEGERETTQNTDTNNKPNDDQEQTLSQEETEEDKSENIKVDKVNENDEKQSKKDTEGKDVSSHVQDVDSAHKQCAQMTDMKRMEGTFIGQVAMCSVDFGLFDTQGLDPRIQGATDVTAVMGNRPTGRFQLFRLFFRMLFNPADVVARPVECLPILIASEWNVNLNNPSDPESDYGRKEHVLNLDGEIYYLKKPEYNVRLFPQRVPLFCNLPKITRRNPR